MKRIRRGQESKSVHIVVALAVVALVSFAFLHHFTTTIHSGNTNRWITRFLQQPSSHVEVVTTSVPTKRPILPPQSNVFVTTVPTVPSTSRVHHMVTNIDTWKDKKKPMPRIVPIFTDPIEESKTLLSEHPLKLLTSEEIETMDMDEIIQFIAQQPMCVNSPVIISMAQVGTELYWQLIENFVYTMVKFRMSDCAVMICVTDKDCMKLCTTSDFPCIYYGHDLYNPNTTLPSTLEQIANLKLLHLPKALRKGVDLLMLDLDVGFLADPMKLIRQFYTDAKLKKKDVIMQQDMVFIMDRSVEKWKTWYVYPMPNIGLFLARGTNKTADMFNVAWEDYQTMSSSRRALPGKDQNKVVEAMKQIGLQWIYWPQKTAPLLDKVFKFENKTFELGGEAAHRWFGPQGTVAVHTTCYEQRTKMMGLKASNAFWNPYYYNPHRKTLTKQLLWTGDEIAFKNELRSLVYLALITDRSLIVPNVLGPDTATAVDFYDNRAYWPGFRILRNRPINNKPSTKKTDEKKKKEGWLQAFHQQKSKHNHNNESSFSSSSSSSSFSMDPSSLSVLEPGFYWRVLRDYSKQVPEPFIVSFQKGVSLRAMEMVLLQDHVQQQPRIVLDMTMSVDEIHHDKDQEMNNKRKEEKETERRQRLITWSKDSVGMLRLYREEIVDYVSMPIIDTTKISIQKLSVEKGKNKDTMVNGRNVGGDQNGPSEGKLALNVVEDYRSCNGIFQSYTMRGNRSCFDRCR